MDTIALSNRYVLLILSEPNFEHVGTYVVDRAVQTAPVREDLDELEDGRASGEARREPGVAVIQSAPWLDDR